MLSIVVKKEQHKNGQFNGVSNASTLEGIFDRRECPYNLCTSYLENLCARRIVREQRAAQLQRHTCLTLRLSTVDTDWTDANVWHFPREKKHVWFRGGAVHQRGNTQRGLQLVIAGISPPTVLQSAVVCTGKCIKIQNSSTNEKTDQQRSRSPLLQPHTSNQMYITPLVPKCKNY